MSPRAAMNKLDEKTWVPLGATVAIVGSIFFGTWRISTAVADLKSEVRASWSVHDMQEWSYRLERANRSSALSVPDPQKVRADRIASEARDVARMP